jgi:hypothetical protein
MSKSKESVNAARRPLWRPTLTMPFAAAGGLILGTSATVRVAGEILIAPALIFVLAAAASDVAWVPGAVSGSPDSA